MIRVLLLALTATNKSVTHTRFVFLMEPGVPNEKRSVQTFFFFESGPTLPHHLGAVPMRMPVCPWPWATGRT